jgi:uroporphyrinogen III methyltransferase/synthase
VSNGSTAKQKIVRGTLGKLEAPPVSPAVIVVGGVCSLAGAFPAPAGSALPTENALSGIRIAVTRPRGGINRLAGMLRRKGAEVVEIPTIAIVYRAETPLLYETLAGISAGKTGKAWFAFTSVHGVEAFFAKLTEYHADIRAFAACKFAAIGSATCAALAGRGIFADLVPEVFSGAALGAALAKTATKDETIILPRSSIGGREILDALRAAGLRYIDIPVYDTLPETGYENPAFRARLVDGLDYAAFTSPSAVEAFVKIFDITGIPALCIGEATAAPARTLGMEAIVPEKASLEGMAEALVKRRLSEP